MIPVRAARGEDVTSLLAALKAEALNRALRQRILAEELVRDAWMRAITRLIGGALAVAIP